MKNESAPTAGNALAVCPHCWEVNAAGSRLCGRCGADMALLLQESGGARRVPPVQSPVPVRVLRLSMFQRVLLFCFVMLMLAVQVVGVLYASARRLAPAASAVPTVPAPLPSGLD
jgi:hypothetical protein